MFHRKRKPTEMKKKSKSSGNASAEIEPFEPDDIEEVNVEDLIKDNLRVADKKLEILDEKMMSSALDEFVNKGQAQAINEAVGHKLKQSQKKLIKKAGAGIKDKQDVLNEVTKEAEQNREKMVAEEAELERQEKARPRRTDLTATPNSKKPQADDNDNDNDDDDDDDDDDEPAPTPKPKRAKKSPVKKKATTKKPRRKKSYDSDEEEESEEEPDLGDDDNDDDIEETASPPPRRAASSRTSSRGRGKKKDTPAETEESGIEVVDMTQDSPPPAAKPKRKKAATAARGSKRPRQLEAVDSEEDSDDEVKVPSGWAEENEAKSTTSTPTRKKRATRKR